MRGRNLLLAAAIFGASPLANATNGLFLIGSGNISRGMGGVGIATRLDSLSGFANPATTAGMKAQLDVGGDLFIPIAEGRLGSVTAESHNDEWGIDNVYPMPSFGRIFKNDGGLTYSINGGALGGGASVYDKNFFQAAAAGTGDPTLAPKINDDLGVNLLIMEVNPTVAWQSSDKVNSLGLSLVTAIGRFSATGLDLFDPFTQTSGTNQDFSNQGEDWSYGFGARVGWLGDYGNLKVGLVYTSEVDMSEYEDYEELFAENGDLDIPANAGIGISYGLGPFTFALDVSKTFYTGVRSVSNIGPNLAGDPSGSLNPNTQQLGQKEGLGFGYDDQVVTKLGVNFALSPSLAFRFGWNYGKSPIDENREIIFNLLAPAATQSHFTLGGTWGLSDTKFLNFSYIHAYENEQSGPTYVSDDGSNFGSFKMFQNSFGMSLTMKYE